MYDFRFLSLRNRRRLDSDSYDDDKDQKAFQFMAPKDSPFCYWGLNIWFVTSWLTCLCNIITFSTIKLQAGFRGTGALSSSMYLPSPTKERWLFSLVNWAEFCFSEEERKRRSSSASWRTFHGALQPMGLRVHFSLFSEGAKLFYFKSLSLFILKIIWTFWSFQYFQNYNKYS